MSAQAGKGDSPRPVNPTVYGQNYDDIFRKPQPETKPTEQTNETENKDTP
jgi:hypothetical protein